MLTKPSTNYQDIPSDWRRRPGRPRQYRDLRKIDIGLDNVPELAADRVLWRGWFVALRTTLVYATDDDDEYFSSLTLLVGWVRGRASGSTIKSGTDACTHFVPAIDACHCGNKMRASASAAKGLLQPPLFSGGQLLNWLTQVSSGNGH